MLSVGGIDVDLSFPEIFFDPDPWKNGLGVLDLTALTWGARYDAKTRPYESPEVVRQWYAKGGLASVKWTSDTVRELFAAGAPPGTTSDPKITPTDDGPSTSTPGPKGSGSGGSPLSDAAIGGIVTGVVGGCLLGLGLAYLFFRYKKRRADAKAEEGGSGPAVKSFSWKFRTKAPVTNKTPVELKAADVSRCELHDGQLCELDGGHLCKLDGGASSELAGGTSPQWELTAGHGMSEMESNDSEVQAGLTVESRVVPRGGLCVVSVTSA